MDLREVARLEETRRATAAAPHAQAVRPITGGGVAVRDKPGSWLNYAVGMGFEAPIPREELASLVEWYASAGIEPRFEVSPFVDAAVLKDCAALGLTLQSFGSVLYRELARDEGVHPVQAAPPGLEVRVVDRRDEARVREYAWVVNRGFTPREFDPSEDHIELACRFVRTGRMVAVAALLDGKMVGGGSLDVDGEVAALSGLSVLEEYRGRGVQQALIAARLNLAGESGARIATVGSRPGATTERNALRMGFGMAYTKVVLVKSGPGLTPIG